MFRAREWCVILALAGAVCPFAVAQGVVAPGRVLATTSPGPVVAAPAQLANLDLAETPALMERVDASSVDAPSATVPAGSAAFSSSVVAVTGSSSSKVTETKSIGPFSTVAVGFQVTSLGFGFEVATPLSRSFNLRGGANFFNLGYDFTVDGANYDFDLELRTGQVSLDWFPFRGNFHVSPGLLIYRSVIAGSANVPGGNVFELGTAVFSSSATDPVHGNAGFTFGRTLMPSITFGFGNMIPRSGSHWSFPFEVGAAYMGHNSVQLNLQGTACVQYTNCLSTSTPAIQQDVINEQSNLNESIKRLQAYPIISTGVAYRF